MTTVNRLDLVISILFTLVGSYVLAGALQMKAMPGMAVGPGLFPSVTGGAMLLLGVAMLVQTWLHRDVAPTQDPLQEPSIAGDDEPETLIDRLYNPLLLLAILAVILLMPVLGFLITGTIFVVAMVLLGGGSWLQAVIFGLIMTGLTYALFVYGLRVPVPAGLWG